MLLFISLTLISTTSCSVQVTYLNGVPRLSNTSYWDYYFNCKTTGKTLIWEVNGTGLKGFLSSNVVSEVSFGVIPNSVNYTAALLSKQERDGQFIFDSILILSVSSKTTLDVACSNGPSIDRTSNIDSTDDGVIRNMSMGSVFEEYLVTVSIVGDEGNTSIFICGVQNTTMYWRIGTEKN